jgi:integrase
LKELLPKLGPLQLYKFTPTFLFNLQQKLKAEGLKNASVNRKTEFVTAILNFATRQRRIPFNPSTGFEKLRLNDKPEMQFWERPEAESFLAFMSERFPRGHESRWVYLVYLIALNTGLRAGEIWGLRPTDIVDHGDSLFVRRQFDRVKKDFGVTKGKKGRHVPCNPQLREELDAWIDLTKNKGDKTIFFGEDGRPMNHDSFADRFERDVKLWGGKRIRFHDLRHTAITLMIAQGIDIKTMKEVAGHKAIDTTMNYVHMLGSSIKNVARSFSISPTVSAEIVPLRKPVTYR